MSLALRWVQAYTKGLPEQLRAHRHDEITSDIHEQLAYAGASAQYRRVRLAVVGRTARGAVDDLMWRRQVGRSMKQERGITTALTQAWWAPLAALVALFDVGFAVAVLADEQSTMPGRVVGPALVLVAAIALFAGLMLRVGAPSASGLRRGAGYSAAVVTLAIVAALVIGGPVALLLGGLIVLGGMAVLLRGVSRGGAVADALVMLGTLPALAMFWLIVPALLAVAVIVGVLTGQPRESPATA